MYEGALSDVIFGGEVTFSIFELNRDGLVERGANICVENPRKFKMHGGNIFSIEDKNHIYYLLICKDSILEHYLAFSKEKPKKGEALDCTRILVHYSSYDDQNICTHQIKSVKRITENLYKMKTKHTYYVLVG